MVKGTPLGTESKQDTDIERVQVTGLPLFIAFYDHIIYRAGSRTRMRQREEVSALVSHIMISILFMEHILDHVPEHFEHVCEPYNLTHSCMKRDNMN